MGVVIDPETNLFLKEIKERGRKEGLLILKKKWNTYNNVLDFSHCVAIAK